MDDNIKIFIISTVISFALFALSIIISWLNEKRNTKNMLIDRLNDLDNYTREVIDFIVLKHMDLINGDIKNEQIKYVYQKVRNGKTNILNRILLFDKYSYPSIKMSKMKMMSEIFANLSGGIEEYFDFVIDDKLNQFMHITSEGRQWSDVISGLNNLFAGKGKKEIKHLYDEIVCQRKETVVMKVNTDTIKEIKLLRNEKANYRIKPLIKTS